MVDYIVKYELNQCLVTRSLERKKVILFSFYPYNINNVTLNQNLNFDGGTKEMKKTLLFIIPLLMFKIPVMAGSLNDLDKKNGFKNYICGTSVGKYPDLS